MRKLHCPNVLAAATRLVAARKQAEGLGLWALGDALIKDCAGEDGGHPTSSHVNNGSLATLEVAAKELERNGIFYEVRSLRDIRDIARTFKKADRVEGLSFYAHAEARSPDCLKWIMKAAPASAKKDAKNRWGIISVVTIREMAQQYYAAVDQKRQRAFEEAQRREAAATTLDEKRAAKAEVERLEGMPKVKAGREFKPAMGELRMTAGWLGVTAEIGISTEHLQKSLDYLHQLKELHPDHVGAAIEHLEQHKKLVLQIDNFLHGRSNVRNIA